MAAAYFPFRTFLLRTFAMAFALAGAFHSHAQELPALDQEEQRLLQADPRSLLHNSNDQGTYYSTTRLADMENRDEREAPAQIQIITSRQLRSYGVQNLREALMLVPGLSVAIGRDETAGLGVHGSWAMEGLCLFLLNGDQLNENGQGSFPLDERIPLANVERIEVLTGPASMLYGGFAGLGVVNIVTRSAEQGPGSTAQVRGGMTESGSSFTDGTVSGAHRLSGQQEISYLYSQASGNRSNARYLLPDGTPVRLADSTAFMANTFQFTYGWKDLKVRMAYMDERQQVPEAACTLLRRDAMVGLEQRTQVAKPLELYWRAAHDVQAPWSYTNTLSAALVASNTTNQRTSALASLLYKPWEGVAIRAGFTGYQATSTFDLAGSAGARYLNGESSIQFHSLAWFAEGSWQSKAGVLLAGIRQEQHSLAGSFVAPRLAYTRVLGRFHVKLLWGSAYHIPSLVQLEHAAPGFEPADGPITGLQAELGFRIGKSTRITGNIYQMTLSNPLEASVDSLLRVEYCNGNTAGTEGIDARIQVETKRISLLAGAGINRMVAEAVATPDLLNGPEQAPWQELPAARVVFAAGYDAFPWLSAHVRGNWQSAISSPASGEAAVRVHLPSQIFLASGLTLRPGKERRFTIDLSCSNILDTERVLTSPGNDGLPLMRLNGRQWLFGLAYKIVK